jgi:hypothetical protein
MAESRCRAVFCADLFDLTHVHMREVDAWIVCSILLFYGSRDDPVEAAGETIIRALIGCGFDISVFIVCFFADDVRDAVAAGILARYRACSEFVHEICRAVTLELGCDHGMRTGDKRDIDTSVFRALLEPLDQGYLRSLVPQKSKQRVRYAEKEEEYAKPGKYAFRL